MSFPQGCLWPCSVALAAALVPAGGGVRQLSGAELVARETAYHASRAVIALFDFNNTQKTDAHSLEFRNSSGAAVEVAIYNAGDTAMLVPSRSTKVNARTSFRYDTGAFGGTRNLKIFVKGLTPCFTRTGVRAPTIVNISAVSGATCTATALPVSQRTPADLLTYGPTLFRARHRAHTQQLTYFVSQTREYLFVSFLGTDSSLEGNEDMNADGGLTINYPGFKNVYVHHGWAKAVGDIYPELTRLINEWKGSRKLIVTGFSMGGALAGYLTYRLLADGVTSPIWLATFGAPRHATQDFRDSFKKLLVAPHRAYTMEIVDSEGDRDPKWDMWKKYYPLVKFDVYPTGQLVEYRCTETKEYAECENYSHVERFYAQAAAFRWNQK